MTWARRVVLAPSGPLQRRTRLPRTRTRTQRREAAPIPHSVRRAVTARSGGWCEGGCGRPAAHVHHRKLRSQGGTHDPVNLAHLATVCHVWAHANPLEAVALGLIVPSWADPAEVPL